MKNKILNIFTWFILSAISISIFSFFWLFVISVLDYLTGKNA